MFYFHLISFVLNTILFALFSSIFIFHKYSLLQVLHIVSNSTSSADLKYPKLKYKGRAEGTLLRNKDPSVSSLLFH